MSLGERYEPVTILRLKSHQHGPYNSLAGTAILLNVSPLIPPKSDDTSPVDSHCQDRPQRYPTTSTIVVTLKSPSPRSTPGNEVSNR